MYGALNVQERHIESRTLGTVSDLLAQRGSRMKLIAETMSHPVKLVVSDDEIGEVSMDITIWLDHNGRQSGVGTIHGEPSLISTALEEVDVEVNCGGERFNVVIDRILETRHARFELLGEVPEPLLGIWRAV
jgi:hypothetical protein